NELFVNPNSLIRWTVCRAGTVADPMNLFSLLCYTNVLCISQRGETIRNNKIGRSSLITAVLKKDKKGISGKSSKVQR
ncbi:MAG: hypothetical protein U9Q89_00830, partial [Thermodesulfobacteriota bacterium]|nr:hypothetical protein [Thermodesulfobacteriota bacterium]